MSATGVTLLLIATTLGLLVGFSVGQGSTCAVTAGKELVFGGRPRLLAGFLVASGAAGILCFPLAWAVGMSAGLPPEAPLDEALVIGALLLAAGALVNDACLFGTLARVALGEVRFLAVPAGLALGFAATDRLMPAQPLLTPNQFGHPSIAPACLVLVSAFILAGAWRYLERGGDDGDRHRWPLRLAMVVLGATGVLLFALTPGWTYADAVRRAVDPGPGGASTAAIVAGATGLATLVGAVMAGLVARRFVYQPPRPATVARSLAGGALMALGAGLVPGGNDSLLLWAVPGGSVSGLVAYLIMTGAIVAALLLSRVWLGRSGSPEHPQPRF